MKDLVSFMVRGAWGGGIFTLLLTVFLYGSVGAYFFLDLTMLANAALPGTIVGVVLWFVAGKSSKPINAGLRFAIGAGVVIAVTLVLIGYQFMTDLEVVGFVRNLDGALRISIVEGGLGGLAGLLCPASREDRESRDKSTYRERLQAYEAAEQEAAQARAKKLMNKESMLGRI